MLSCSLAANVYNCSWSHIQPVYNSTYQIKLTNLCPVYSPKSMQLGNISAPQLNWRYIKIPLSWLAWRRLRVGVDCLTSTPSTYQTPTTLIKTTLRSVSAASMLTTEKCFFQNIKIHCKNHNKMATSGKTIELSIDQRASYVICKSRNFYWSVGSSQPVVRGPQVVRNRGAYPSGCWK